MVQEHIKNYCDAFGIGEQDRDTVLCEVCGACPCQIHHILGRTAVINPHEVWNLIALCSAKKDCCHDIAHGKIRGKKLTREMLFEITEKRDNGR